MVYLAALQLIIVFSSMTASCWRWRSQKAWDHRAFEVIWWFILCRYLAPIIVGCFNKFFLYASCFLVHVFFTWKHHVMLCLDCWFFWMHDDIIIVFCIFCYKYFCCSILFVDLFPWKDYLLCVWVKWVFLLTI